jgi:putative cell wall-binding protein
VLSTALRYREEVSKDGDYFGRPGACTVTQTTTSVARSGQSRRWLRRLVIAITIPLLAIGSMMMGAMPAPAVAISITGTVTAADTGSPLYNVYVGLLDTSGNSTVFWADTDVNGNYQMASVPDGSYTMTFAPQSTDPYAGAYFPAAQFFTGASFFTVSSGSTTDVSTALPKAGSVSGHLTFSHDPCGGNISLLAYDAVSAFWRYTDFVSPELSGDWTMTNVRPGNYRVEFHGCDSVPNYPKEYYNDIRAWEDAELVTVTAGVTTQHIDATLDEDGPSNVARIAGQDRFATSARIAHEFTTADTVFVANGLGFPDALSAAPAAAFLHAPLLLTLKDSLPAVVKAQIQRLQPDTIYVVGGTGVVSTAVFNELDALAGTGAIRLSGADRYATSREVFTTIWNGRAATVVFLADGRNFPDALASTAAASTFLGPVVLVNGGSSTLPSGFGATLQTFSTSNMYLAGGTAVLSTGIENAIHDLPGISVVRFAGSDRYDTSFQINDYFFGETGTAFMAVGTGFADALAGAALAGGTYYPLYLVPGTCVPQSVLDNISDLSSDRIVLLGGTGVLSTAVENLTSCTPTV